MAYKVLWVDDEPDKIKGDVNTAKEEYELEPILCRDWQSAKSVLELSFNEISAIILDANCKLTPDSIISDEFIYVVQQDLASMFALKQNMIPWFIFSAGTMNNFEYVVRAANTSRKEREEVWGPMLYGKITDDPDKSIDALFSRIQSIAPNQIHNKIIARFSDVFENVGAGKIIDSARARKYLLETLSALYEPKGEIKFNGNPLRQVVEVIFKSLHKYGFFPDEFITPGDDDMAVKTAIKDSSLFLSGQVVKHAGYGVFYDLGKDSKGRTKGILPPYASDALKNIIFYANESSHPQSNPNLIVKAEDQNLFCGYLFHLCYIITFIAKYIKDHPDFDENHSKIKYI